MAVRLHLSGGHLCSGPGEPSLCLVAASCVRDASPESSTNIQSVSECGFGRNGSDELERYEHCVRSSKRSDNGECGGRRGWSGQQQREFYRFIERGRCRERMDFTHCWCERSRRSGFRRQFSELRYLPHDQYPAILPIVLSIANHYRLYSCSRWLLP